MLNVFKFVFGQPEELPVRHFSPTMVIEAKNEVGETITLEVPKPYLHPESGSRVSRNRSFLNYGSDHDQK
jgi:hypothetical protein